MHPLGKPKPQERNTSIDTLDYGLSMSQRSGKSQKPAAKGARKPTGGQTKIKVFNNTCKVYKHHITQDKAKNTCVMSNMFELFEHLLGKEQCKQWIDIQVCICDHEWQDHDSKTQPKRGVM